MELVARRHHRIDILDAVRGIAILSMVVYHALYDIEDVFGIRVPVFEALAVLEPPFAGAFILLAGISCRFSHNNVRRGVRVLAVAMIVTLVTALFSYFVAPGETIVFGILHFMGAAILLYVCVGPAVDRIPPVPAAVLWTVLFALTYSLPWSDSVGIQGLFTVALPEWTRHVPGLFLLGMPDAHFSSADYFPLIPWMFLFLLGTVLGVPIRDHRLPDWFYSARVPFFAAAGRNTLQIYVLHQPVIYLLLWLFFRLAGGYFGLTGF